MAEEEFVYVLGPEGSGMPGVVTRKAYDDIWKGKGFTIVSDEEGALAHSPATQAELQEAEATKRTTTTAKKG